MELTKQTLECILSGQHYNIDDKIITRDIKFNREYNIKPNVICTVLMCGCENRINSDVVKIDKIIGHGFMYVYNKARFRRA